MYQRPSLVQIKHQRDHFAAHFAQASVLQTEIADRLLERLDYMRLDPENILDLSVTCAHNAEQLTRRYSQANIYAADFSWHLLREASARIPQAAHLLCSELERLPLSSASVGLIVSNLSLAWLDNPEVGLKELLRVLKPGGLLLFTSLGPDTLNELRYSFSGIDNYSHVYDFMDMHHLGDSLLATGWQDPVMDMEVLTMAYDKLSDLISDLRIAGGKNLLANRCPHLMSVKKWRTMEACYAELILENHQLPASFEIVYGHAWKAEKTNFAQFNEQGEAVIAIDSIKRSSR